MPRQTSSNASSHAQNKPNDEELVQNGDVDDFFTRMNYDLRRPKPGDEDIAAAQQAIDRMMGGPVAEALDSSKNELKETRTCATCGNGNPPSHKFCGTCGNSTQTSETPALEAKGGELYLPDAPPSPALPPGRHHYHHHYHYVSPEAAQSVQGFGASVSKDALRPRAVVGGPSSNRADAAVRKLSQDWSVACNTRHLDDLVELYAQDALVLRPNVPTIRGTAAIREFLFSALEAGLGEVELEALRVDVFGEVAYEAGRSKMVVPVALSKRREERGKYLIVSTRASGEWKIVCDLWSSDLSLQSNPPTIPGKSAIPVPIRKP